jgi:hypothetical protein
VSKAEGYRAAPAIAANPVAEVADEQMSEKVAERAGFEPAMGCPIPHFQCGALGH